MCALRSSSRPSAWSTALPPCVCVCSLCVWSPVCVSDASGADSRSIRLPFKCRSARASECLLALPAASSTTDSATSSGDRPEGQTGAPSRLRSRGAKTHIYSGLLIGRKFRVMTKKKNLSKKRWQEVNSGQLHQWMHDITSQPKHPALLPVLIFFYLHFKWQRACVISCARVMGLQSNIVTSARRKT